MKPNESLGHEPSCRSLLIVGAGVMGQGIARLFAAAGIDVTLMDCQDVKISHPGVQFVRETPAAAPDLVIEACSRMPPSKSPSTPKWRGCTAAGRWSRRIRPVFH